MPVEYGPWQTVYGRFRQWQRNGTWAPVLTGLHARADAVWALPRRFTKVHLACEQGQKPLSILITAGQRGDSPQFRAVLERNRAVATRYDELAVRYQATVHIAAINEWLPRHYETGPRLRAGRADRPGRARAWLPRLPAWS